MHVRVELFKRTLCLGGEAGVTFRLALVAAIDAMSCSADRISSRMAAISMLM